MSSTVGAFFVSNLKFFLVVLASSVFGDLTKKTQFPKITGYLLCGVLCGPYVFSFLKSSDIVHIKWSSQAPVAMVAYMCGSELFWPDIKKLLFLVSAHTIILSTFTVCVVAAMVMAVSGSISFLSSLGSSCQVGVAFLCGCLMIERSPTTAFALISELKAQGPATRTLVGITVLTNVVLLILFAITSTVAAGQCTLGTFDVGVFVELGFTIGSCIVVGVFISGVLILVLNIPKPFRSFHKGALIALIGFGVFYGDASITAASLAKTSYRFTIEPILSSVLSAAILVNYSQKRRKFANILRHLSYFVFAIFYTQAGVGFDLVALWYGLPFAFAISFARLVAIASSTYICGRWVVKSPKLNNRFLWMTLLTNGAPLLALSSELKSLGPWAEGVAASCIGALIIDHLVGVKTFKWGLSFMGEIMKQGVVPLHEGPSKVVETAVPINDEKEVLLEEQAVNNGFIVFGLNPLSLILGVKLIGKHGVQMVSTTLLNFNKAKEIFYAKKLEMKEVHDNNDAVPLSLSHEQLNHSHLRDEYLALFGETVEQERLKTEELLALAPEERVHSLDKLMQVVKAFCNPNAFGLVACLPNDNLNYFLCKTLSILGLTDNYKSKIVVVREPLTIPRFSSLGWTAVYPMSVLSETVLQVALGESPVVTFKSNAQSMKEMVHPLELRTTSDLKVVHLTADFSGYREDHQVYFGSAFETFDVGYSGTPAAALIVNASDVKELEENEDKLRQSFVGVSRLLNRSGDKQHYDDESNRIHAPSGAGSAHNVLRKSTEMIATGGGSKTNILRSSRESAYVQLSADQTPESVDGAAYHL